MSKRPYFFRALLISSVLSAHQITAFAAGVEWSGVYRIEGYSITNHTLDDADKQSLDYGLSHLVLKPKIVPADGLTVQSRWDVFNKPGLTSQHGAIFGGGVADSGGEGIPNSNTQGGTVKAETLAVTQLYLTYAHEFGALVVGRVPKQFGFGITHDAGSGDFDHWFNTRDAVGYKVVMGNSYFMITRSKQIEGQLNRNSDDINEWDYHFQYDNPETDLSLGVLYTLRKGNSWAVAQDTDLLFGTGGIGGTGASLGDKLDMKTFNIFAQRDRERYRFGVEASFVDGSSGVVTGAGEPVELSSFAVVSEFEYRPAESRARYGLRAGVVTGDDPTTDAAYEGYHLNRNYDVAMMLFNQPMGKDGQDILGSRANGGKAAATSPTYKLDNESITNTFYLSPYWVYQWRPHWGLGARLVYASLRQDSLANSVDMDLALGWEVDFSVTYAPFANFQWTTEVGFLQPGDAWVGGDLGNDPSSAFGFTTKAAISF